MIVGPALGVRPGSLGLCQDGCIRTAFGMGCSKEMTDSYKVNDAVGMLWDGAGKVVAFTKNGHPIPRSAVTLPIGRRWFPAVSLGSQGVRLRLNFGSQQF